MLITIVGLHLTGCGTTGRERLKQDQLQTEAQQNTAFAAAVGAQAIASSNPDLVKPALDRIAAKDAEIGMFFHAVDTRLKEVERFKSDTLGSLTSLASIAVPNAAVLFTALGQKIQTATTSVAMLDTKQNQQEKQIAEQRLAIDRLELERKALETKLQSGEAALATLKASLEKTGTDLRDRVAALPTEQHERIKAGILEELQRQGATKEKIEEAASMSAPELVGLVGGGGAVGLAALTALFRTLGASRGQKEIDELWESLSNAKSQIEKVDSLKNETHELREKQVQLLAELSRLSPRSPSPPLGS